MSKHLKDFKMLLYGEDKTQDDVCNYLKSKGFEHYSVGYVSTRMTGKANWNMEEVYAFAEWLQIPDEEILSYFPRRKQPQKDRIRRIV